VVPVSHHLPWQVNVAAKLVLSRMPVSYRTWKKLGFFNAGEMDRPEYAFTVFDRHFRASGLGGRRRGEERRGFTCLELGPGDSISSALIACSFGASHTWLVDVGSFATSDVNRYRDLATYLRQQGLPVTDISPAQNFDQLLSLWSGTYLVEGLKSLREIPSASVDFVFSHASLQQVRRSEFLPVIQELRRIQKPDGIGSHSVSMRDLIGGAANDLRFSTRAWESQLMAHAGFYTNRLRYSQMLGIFKEVGFQIEVTHVGKWDHLPIPRQKLAPEFRKFTDDDLLTYEWDVLLR
jgi:SAM-dependent methyltransferase